MRAVIDTCVIIDVLQSREPFYETAQLLFLAAANEQFVGCITAKSVADIYYLTHRLTHSDTESREILKKLFSLFEIIDTTGADCHHAIPSPVSDFEDAIMIETALRSECSCIVTRNSVDYIKSPIPVYEPDSFLQYLEKEVKER